MHTDSTDDQPTLTQFWEARYGDAGQVWSGRVNATMADVVAPLPVGRALDLGCGEGGDAIWLALRGWQVTGVDISTTAIARASAAATGAGVRVGRVEFVAEDLDAWTRRGPHGPYQLVTASFLHSPAEIPRADILRRAAGFVAPDGHLLVLSHADFPPWSQHRHEEHRFLSPDEEIAALGLPADEWGVRLAETRTRTATGPDGQPATLDDTVVLLHRAARPAQ